MILNPTTHTQTGLHHLLDAGSFVGLSEAQLLSHYTREGDERAFDVILNRHGPMVLGVCRRFLFDPHDIDDAFQATFLILVRKAPTLRDPQSLSPWLYGVASKVALRARASRRLQTSRESSAPILDPADPSANPSSNDWLPILDEELNRLPARFRNPVILCHLEGLTHDAAALRLGCPVGTLRSRLSRAREKLRQQLTRRGLAPSLAAPELLLDSLRPYQPIPAHLIQATLQTLARTSLAKTITTATTSAALASLTKGVLTTMTFFTLKTAASLAALAIVMGTSTLLLAQPESARKKSSPASAAKPAPQLPEEPKGDPNQNTTLLSPPELTTRDSPRLLKLKLRIAMKKLSTSKPMLDSAIISQSEYAALENDVELLKAQIEEERENLQEELRMLLVRREAKEAEMSSCAIRIEHLERGLERAKKLIAIGELDSGGLDTIQEQSMSLVANRDQRKSERRLIELQITRVERRLRQLSDPEASKAELPNKSGSKNRDERKEAKPDK